MRVKFNVNVNLNLKDGAKFFARGEHELPAEIANHWYVKALIKEGKAEAVQAPPKKPVAVKPAPAQKPAAAPVQKPAQAQKPADGKGDQTKG